MEDSLINSKLIQLLSTFSKDEMKEFERFVNSPFHNSRKEVTGFCKILRRYHPSFSGPNFTKAHLFKTLFPDKKYNDADFRRYVSYLYKLAEEYLSICIYKKQPFQFNSNTLRGLMEKNLDKLSDSKIKYLKHIHSKHDFFYDEYFLESRLLQAAIVDHNLFKGRQSEITANVINRSDFTVYDFLLSGLSDMYDLYVNNQSYNAGFDSSVIKIFFDNLDLANFFATIKDNNEKFFILVLLSYYRYKTQINLDDEESFNSLVSTLEKAKPFLKHNALFSRYLGLQTFCFSRYLDGGELSYALKMREIYMQMLKENIYGYRKGGEFLNMLYRNMIFLGFELRDVDFIELLVNDYRNKLSEKYREDLVSLGSALAALLERKFERSIGFLNKIAGTYSGSLIDVREILLRNFYELNYYDTLVSHLDSYKHYLNNYNELNGQAVMKHKMFVSLTLNLLKIRDNSKYDELPILKKKVDGLNFIRGRQWLLEKIDELQKSARPV